MARASESLISRNALSLDGCTYGMHAGWACSLPSHPPRIFLHRECDPSLFRMPGLMSVPPEEAMRRIAQPIQKNPRT
jgi:hypothetical protein